MSLYQKAKELREERAKNWEDQKGLQSKSKEESRNLSAEEQAKWDQIETRQAELEAEIGTVEADIASQEERQESLDNFDPMAVERDNIEPDAAPDTRHAFTKWARRGVGELTAEERATLGYGKNPLEAPVAGDYVTIDLRAQSTTDSAGGHTIAEDTSFRGRVVEAMQAFGGIRSVASVLSTATGADLPMPTVDDTSNAGALLAENTQVSEQDLTFGATTLEAFKYSSKAIRVSVELMQDTAFDLDAYIARALGTRIGRITNTHFTVGDGSSKPRGVFTAASSGKTAASATAFTYDELLDLKHAVDPAYRANGSWMFNDTTLKAIKQLSIGTGDARPLWAPGIVVGEPDTIDGDPYTINQDAATAATTTTPIAYGDFSYYYIRDVSAITVLRLVERYADYHQVGFLAFSRHDGDLVDGGGGAVKKLTMA